MNLLKALYRQVASEPLVVFAAVVAAVNASTVQSWQGYATAAVTALLRFAVSPVVSKG